jgi:hypothetical protein
MSRFRIAMAAGGIAIVALATLSSAAEARLRIGGPIGVVRFAASRMLGIGGMHRAYRHRHVRQASLRSPEIRSPDVRSPDIRMATTSATSGGLGALTARGRITAAAALAGWQGGRTAKAWWQHDDGSYGWVGPLFWPFAWHDLQDYAIWGDGTGFWAYGGGDIYAAIFAPYGREALASYTAASPSGRRSRRGSTLQPFCGDDGGESAGPAVDRLQQELRPTEVQRAALDELASASRSAAQTIRATCPTQPPATAPARLAAMRERLQAMIKAGEALQPPLENFYALLNDEQKARLNAATQGSRETCGAGKAAEAQAFQGGPSAASKWPQRDIDTKLQLNDTQRGALEVVQDTSAGAAEALSAECRPDAITPPARLAAAKRRLDAMLQAVSAVSDALDDFYATLGDEQKTQFEAIGPKRTAIAGRAE